MTRAQIASLPDRVDSLKLTVESLLPQVDSLFVALNNYEFIPEFLNQRKITFGVFKNQHGDAEKFFNVEKYDGYFFSCDDDLIYPKDYISRMVFTIQHMNCLVTHHGKIFANRPIHSYYHGATKSLRCLSDVFEPCFVDVCGSGVTGFNTKDLKVKLSDFKRKNMADIWLSKLAHEQGVKMLCLSHSSDYFGYVHPVNNIYDDSHKKEEYQTKLINTFLK